MGSNKLILGMIFGVLFLGVSSSVIQDAYAGIAAFQKGDLLVSTGNGNVSWFNSDLTLNQIIDCGSGFTTGSSFDSDGNLYVTMFSSNQICKVNTFGQVIGNFGTGYSTPEKILFDAAGNAFVGNLGGFILKLDSDGNTLQSFNTGRVDFMDLSADQCTMLYGQEGNRVLRYDVCTDTQLSDFSNSVVNAFAMRILPNGDLLVADRDNVKRLNSAGDVIQTYDVSGEGQWFALNLDPDGTSFWSAGISTSNVYKFDINSGEQLASFNAGAPGNTFGVSIFGEVTAAVPEPESDPITDIHCDVVEEETYDGVELLYESDDLAGLSFDVDGTCAIHRGDAEPEIKDVIINVTKNIPDFSYLKAVMFY